jgi:hypothetical protein
MSLIKAADVPKHLADRLKSRRLAARLAQGTGTQPILPTKKITVAATSQVPDSPATL